IFTDSLKIVDRDMRKSVLDTYDKFLKYILLLDDIRKEGSLIRNNSIEKNSIGFLIEFLSNMIAYDLSMNFIENNNKNDLFEVVLNEKISELNLPKNTYYDLKKDLIHINTFAKIEDSYEVYNYLKRKNCFKFYQFPIINQLLSNLYNDFNKMIIHDGVKLLSNAGNATVKETLKSSFFPIKESILNQLSETRLTRRNYPLLTVDQCDTIVSISKPGDIVLQRQEWYVTNYGIPGFWSHVAMYLGTPEQLIQYSNNPEIDKYYNSLDSNCTSFKSFMEKHHRDAWQKYNKLSDEKNYQFIEAISEGVVYNSAENSIGHCDYVAVLRPKIEPLDIIKSIERAFEQYGKPYDYDFDLRKNEALVCSGLIFKAYSRSINHEGLNLQTSDIIGGLVMPPNYLCEKYNEDKKNVKEMDFIIFYDSNGLKAFRSNEDEFCKSASRSEWHLWIK
ncbi:MAG: hypothetical protein JXR48_02695, partial [Candidatus Delongbacteria bacterium]|nr:hypothetical protein [Candidatus Delongbacteria bacterium]